jgi:hypothetical protein
VFSFLKEARTMNQQALGFLLFAGSALLFAGALRVRARRLFTFRRLRVLALLAFASAAGFATVAMLDLRQGASPTGILLTLAALNFLLAAATFFLASQRVEST